MFPLVCFVVCSVFGKGKVVDCFHSESNPSKRDFGNFMSKTFSKDAHATHVFPDMTQLGGDKSACSAAGHDGPCCIPGAGTDRKPLLGCVGFCCHNYSKLFQGAGLQTVGFTAAHF